MSANGRTTTTNNAAASGAQSSTPSPKAAAAAAAAAKSKDTREACGSESGSGAAAARSPTPFSGDEREPSPSLLENDDELDDVELAMKHVREKQSRKERKFTPSDDDDESAPEPEPEPEPKSKVKAKAKKTAKRQHSEEEEETKKKPRKPALDPDDCEEERPRMQEDYPDPKPTNVKKKPAAADSAPRKRSHKRDPSKLAPRKRSHKRDPSKLDFGDKDRVLDVYGFPADDEPSAPVPANKVLLPPLAKAELGEEGERGLRRWLFLLQKSSRVGNCHVNGHNRGVFNVHVEPLPTAADTGDDHASFCMSAECTFGCLLELTAAKVRRPMFVQSAVTLVSPDPKANLFDTCLEAASRQFVDGYNVGRTGEDLDTNKGFTFVVLPLSSAIGVGDRAFLKANIECGGDNAQLMVKSWKQFIEFLHSEFGHKDEHVRFYFVNDKRKLRTPSRTLFHHKSVSDDDWEDYVKDTDTSVSKHPFGWKEAVSMLLEDKDVVYRPLHTVKFFGSSTFDFLMAFDSRLDSQHQLTDTKDVSKLPFCCHDD
jgi:hypothetical protein